MADAPESWKQLPAILRQAAERQFAEGEAPVAWLQTDLDARLFYVDGLIVLTDRRLLGATTDLTEPEPHPRWQSWPTATLKSVRASEHAGLGSLEALGPEGRLAEWRYTGRRSADAHRLIRKFNQLRRSDSGESTIIEQTADERPKESAIRLGVLLRLSRFARPRLGMIVLGFVLTLLSTIAGLIPPYLTIPLLDKVLIPHQNGQPVDFGVVPWYLFGLGAAAAMAWLLGWARTYVIAWVSERISSDLRNSTYAHLQRLSLEFFGGKRTGDLMSRIGLDTERICYFLSVNLLDFCNDVLMIALTSVVLFSINPTLAVVTLAPFPFIAFLIHHVREKLSLGFDRGRRAMSELNSILADTIPGIRVVKAFAQERREIERFRSADRHVLDANDRINSTWSFFGPMVTLLTEGGLLVIWAFGVWMVYRGQIQVGVLTAFVAYISRFYVKLESMSRMVAAMHRAAASTQRVFEILDMVPSVAEPNNPIHPTNLLGKIEFRSVGFQYGNRPILHGIDLEIRPGEMVGLVGPSGAGKSTLVNLVCRFYDVTEGAIVVDGVDIRSFGLIEYRQNIGIVLQEPFLFYGTIAENIAYGRPNATRAEIIAAARAARANEFILRLPDGYDSLVGERGQSLSGGERQRISIARALLIDPKILILDEATSSVDTETEREIQAALDNLIRGRTTIAIAHRLSTLRKADRVVVLEHGRIAESGKHDQLLERDGVYSRLHRAQAELAAGGAEAANVP